MYLSVIISDQTSSVFFIIETCFEHIKIKQQVKVKLHCVDLKLKDALIVSLLFLDFFEGLDLFLTR